MRKLVMGVWVVILIAASALAAEVGDTHHETFWATSTGLSFDPAVGTKDGVSYTHLSSITSVTETGASGTSYRYDVAVGPLATADLGYIAVELTDDASKVRRFLFTVDNTTATSILDEAISGHTTSGTVGEKINNMPLYWPF